MLPVTRPNLSFPSTTLKEQNAPPAVISPSPPSSGGTGMGSSGRHGQTQITFSTQDPLSFSRNLIQGPVSEH